MRKLAFEVKDSRGALDCADFSTRTEAQAILDQDRSDLEVGEDEDGGYLVQEPYRRISKKPKDLRLPRHSAAGNVRPAGPGAREAAPRARTTSPSA